MPRYVYTYPRTRHYNADGTYEWVEIRQYEIPDFDNQPIENITIHRMISKGDEMFYNGGIRTIIENAYARQSLDGENSVLHDKITYPQIVTSISNPRANTEYVSIPFKLNSNTDYAKDDTAGVWFVPCLGGYAQFSVYQRGSWRCTTPSGYINGVWVERGSYHDWYVSYFDVPGGSYSGFKTAREAYAFALELVGQAAIYARKPELNATVRSDGYITRRGMLSHELKSYRLSGDGISFDVFDRGEVHDRHIEPLGLRSSLVTEAFSALNFNSNNIANLLAIKDLFNVLRNPGGFLDDLVSQAKKGIFDNSKNAWLQYRYVYSTTLSDIDEAIRYCTKADTYTCRAGTLTDEGEMHVKIKLSSDIQKKASQLDTLSELGLAPDLYNAWDMVPFSFVVDWFVPIGDFMEQVTNYGKTLKYDINAVVYSWKWRDVVEIPLRDFPGVTFKAQLEHYARTVTDHVPDFIPYIESGVSDSTLIKRCLDGVALFVG